MDFMLQSACLVRNYITIAMVSSFTSYGVPGIRLNEDIYRLKVLI